MTIAYVQDNSANSTSVSTNSSVSASNALTVVIQAQYPNSTSAGYISDTAGGTWTNLGNVPVTTVGQGLVFVCNNPSAAIHTVTWHPAAGPTYGTQLNIAEWSGGSLNYDQGVGQAVGSSTSNSTPTITPTYTGELLLAIGDSSGNGHTWTNPTNGFTALTVPPVDAGNVFAYLVDSSASAISCSWTVTSADSGSTWIFAVTTSGSPPPPVLSNTQGLIMSLI